MHIPKQLLLLIPTEQLAGTTITKCALHLSFQEGTSWLTWSCLRAAWFNDTKQGQFLAF